jgi:hypothetical protein
MGKASILCVILVFALLLEDGSSVKKKTEDERKEDEEIAEKVNATLAAEEEKKRKEEEDDAQRKKKVRTQDEKKDGKDQDEACPPSNFTCPSVEPCTPCEECPPKKECGSCPPVECGPCDPCPEECPETEECRPCRVCGPCGPCPTINNTRDHQDCPSAPACPGTEGMTVPVALAVGASAGVLLTGVAAAIGLVLRYVPPIVSGFSFLATVVILWYLCSQYPEMARELGGRVVATLREATIALGHRIAEAIRHREQVGFSNPLKFEFHVPKKFALRFSM